MPFFSECLSRTAAIIKTIASYTAKVNHTASAPNILGRSRITVALTIILRKILLRCTCGNSSAFHSHLEWKNQQPVTDYITHRTDNNGNCDQYGGSVISTITLQPHIQSRRNNENYLICIIIYNIETNKCQKFAKPVRLSRAFCSRRRVTQSITRRSIDFSPVTFSPRLLAQLSVKKEKYDSRRSRRFFAANGEKPHSVDGMPMIIR